MRMTKFDCMVVIDGQEIVFNDVDLESGSISANGIRLTLNKESDEVTMFTLEKEDGSEFKLNKIVYDFDMPLRNFGRVLIPDSGRFFMEKYLPRMVWDKSFEANGLSMSNPFFACMDAYENVDFSFGLLGHICETQILFTSPGRNEKNSLAVSGGIANGRLQWRITKPYVENISENKINLGKMKKFEDGIFQSEKDFSWFHSLRKYGKVFTKEHNIEYIKQENGYRPAFCSWRVISSDYMTTEWLLETAKLCKDVGIKGFILDDGWYGVGLDGEGTRSTMGDWPRSIPKYNIEVDEELKRKMAENPDYRETPDKIPMRLYNPSGRKLEPVDGEYLIKDVSYVCAEMKKIGIAPILWFCPISVNPDAEKYDEYKKYLSKINNEQDYYLSGAKFHTLCVSNPASRKIMVDNLKKLISYGAEGIKVDLFDYMPPSICTSDEHEHDCSTTTEGLRKTFKLLFESAIAEKPDLIYSIKNNYGNVELGVYGSNIRGGDSPFDENINILRSVYPNAFAGIVHNDYLAFTNFEEADKVAVLFIKQITTGVPNFSINLQKMSELNKKIMRIWMDFFHRNIDLYKEGDFEPQNSVMSTFQRTNDHKAMISLLYPSSRDINWIDKKEIFVLNASGNEKVYVNDYNPDKKYEVEYYDYEHNLVDKSVIEGDVHFIKVLPAGFTYFKEI